MDLGDFEVRIDRASTVTSRCHGGAIDERAEIGNIVIGDCDCDSLRFDRDCASNHNVTNRITIRITITITIASSAERLVGAAAVDRRHLRSHRAQVRASCPRWWMP
jgi:hypothetical protein